MSDDQQEKKARKPSVPKLERIIALVLMGEYDGQLGELRDAIDQRNEHRKAAVLNLVREVYGDDAQIATSDHPKVNPFIERAQKQNSEQTGDDLLADDDTPTPDALASMDDEASVDQSDMPPGRGGAIIGGLSSSDFA